VAAPSWASGIGGGVTYWDTADAEDDNGFGMKLVFDVGSKWNIDFRAGFFDGHGLVSGPRTIAIEATPIDLGISYDFQTKSKVTPYVGGGFNYTLYKSEVFNVLIDQPESSRIKDEPGWYALIGIDIPIQKAIAVYIEGTYRQNKPTVQGDGLAAFDEIPVDFAGAGATVGLVYTW
jgi:opacity protein-like surface antigen